MTNKKSDKLVDVLTKPEVPLLSSIYHWIQVWAQNSFPETVLLYHFRFLHCAPKTVDFVEISDWIKI